MKPLRLKWRLAVGPPELPWLAFRAQEAEVERRGFRKWWSRNLCAHNAAAVCRRAASFTMGVFRTWGQYSRRPAGLRGWLLETSALSRAASATNGPRTSKRYVTARNRKDEEIAKLRLRLLKHQTLQESKPNSWVVPVACWSVSFTVGLLASGLVGVVGVYACRGPSHTQVESKKNGG